MLVPTPRLVLASTAFAQADRGRGRRAGNGAWYYDDGSPRERLLPRDSPGGTCQRSPRALLSTGDQSVLGQSRRMGRNQTEKETVGERQSEGDKEEHLGSATRPSALALFKCSQLALFFCTVPLRGPLGGVVEQTLVDVANLFNVQRPEAESPGLRRTATGHLDLKKLEGFQQVQDCPVVDRQRIGQRVPPGRLRLTPLQKRKAVGIE